MSNNVIKNPQYIYLEKDGHFVGTGRIVCEFLPAGEDKWQMTPIDWDERKLLKIPPVGIACLKRQPIPKQD